MSGKGPTHYETVPGLLDDVGLPCPGDWMRAPANPRAPRATGIEAQVCEDIARRQQLGIRKYGGTLADNPADMIAKLQHLYEELLDGANYAKWAIVQLRELAGSDTQPPGIGE